MNTAIETLWSDYRSTPCDASRNALIEHYYPLVRKLAYSQADRLPCTVDPDEMMNVGAFGLMEAIEHYDPDRGEFEKYAIPRILGAMKDEMRRMDWVPRLARRRQAAANRARDQLRQDLRHEPNSEEIARSMGLSFKRKPMRDGEIAPPHMGSLSFKCTTQDDGKLVERQHLIMDDAQPDPLGEVVSRDARSQVMRGLRPTEQLILKLYYYEQMTMREVGKACGISESRICQIHTLMMKRLRSRGIVLESLLAPTG